VEYASIVATTKKSKLRLRRDENHLVIEEEFDGALQRLDDANRKVSELLTSCQPPETNQTEVETQETRSGAIPTE
jgi:hypothetical protein